MAGPLRERNSLEISTRVEGTKHVQVGTEAGPPGSGCDSLKWPQLEPV